MRKPNLALLVNGSGAPRDAVIREVHLPLFGRLPQAACGDKVPMGARIAESLDADMGDLHAPFAGEILSVSSEHVAILADGRPDAVDAADLSGSSGEVLIAQLKGLGVALAGLRPAKTLVVGGLEQEPGIGVAGSLLAHRRETLERGLELARRCIAPEKTILVLPKGANAVLAGCETVQDAPVYPNGLAPLAVKAATGRENPGDATHLAAHELFALGRVAETGLPLAETVCAAGEAVFVVKLGTPAGELLKAAGLKAEDGDRVVLGGPMRGRALYSLAQGVASCDYGIFVIGRKDFPPVSDAPCLNCGECAMICPARILPGMLSRFAEFKLFEKAGDYHLDACIDCGLCGLVCPGRRPVLQYIRLAKKELADQRCLQSEPQTTETPSCCGKC